MWGNQLRSATKQLTVNNAIRNGSWFLVAGMLFLVWDKMGRCVFPGLLALDLPGDISLPSGTFIALYILAWLGSPVLLSALPKRWKFTQRIVCMILVSIAARYAFSSLALSQDVSQFMNEGRQFFHSSGRYPPLFLGFTRCVTAFNGSAQLWRAIVFLADMLIICLLIFELKERRLPIRLALIYALHPLVLTSFVGQGHPDVFLILCLLITIICYRRQKWVLMFIALGLAIQIRYYPILLLPVLITRRNWKQAFWTLAIGLGPFLPFCVKEGFKTINPFGYLFYGRPFNSMSHAFFRYLAGDTHDALLISGIVFFLVWLYAIWKLHPGRTNSAALDISSILTILLCLLFFFLPVIHAWLITILIPLLIFRYFFSVSILSLTIATTYIASGYMQFTGEWYFPQIAVLIVWAPFLLLFLLDIHRINLRRKMVLRADGKGSISVIIPVYNEQNQIQKCIEHAEREASEVIVVDAGSTDATVEIARDAGASVISFTKAMVNGGGRGGQINAGLMEATGDYAVVVHADVLVQPGQLDRVKELFARNPEIAGGAMGSRYDQPSVKNDLLVAANDYRAGFLQITYGDQVQFFRRDWILAAGIFPDIPLMEDVELSLRLSRIGQTVYLWESALVSARRRQRGSWSRAMLLIRLTSAWLIHRLLGTPDPVAFYRTYYRK